ncbi:winged helix-turn-helix domain-containing protein [Granulicella sp. S190]|uniref:winged helix-turn-helix domain-containing protein n=1 Tax=Granulicella sp. S190 TaxID=1747226 RepID=UPI00131C398A|nr:winged helix-turn-helix domain-containing protein [Granulicella sp. S190]
MNRKTFDLLLYLIDHRTQVVTKDELLTAVWPDQIVEESNLSQHVFLLRKALSRHESKRKMIETVAGRGYRFVAPLEITPSEENQSLVFKERRSITRVTLEEQIDEDPATIAPASRAETPAKGFTARSQRLLLAAGVLVLIAGLGWFGWTQWQHWLDRTGGPPVQIVLAPLAGTTGDTILDHTLLDALRTDLSQSPFVSVVPSTTVTTTLKQMKRAPDDPMDAATARELCERTNSQAVLNGTLARDGEQFLVTEEATNCVDGATLVAAKREVTRAEDLPGTIDRLTGILRQKLGESRRSIERFSVPIAPADTASLEALKAYSQAKRLSEQGKRSESVGLLKQAISYDPNFGSAYYDLAMNYSSTGDNAGSRKALEKAYSLRDSVGPLMKINITGRYESIVTGDLYAAERDYHAWIALYPRLASAWNNLFIVQRALGEQAEAVVSVQHALALRPKYLGLFTNLADAQLASGDAKSARATCERAIALGVDGDLIRMTLFVTAVAQGDAALLQAERDWAASHPDSPYFILAEGELATSQGRFAEARRFIDQGAEILRHQGFSEAAASLTKSYGANFIVAGDTADGVALLKSAPVDPEEGTEVLGLAQMGNQNEATKILGDELSKRPNDTLWRSWFGPAIRGEIALTSNKPLDAIAALEPTRTLDGRSNDMAVRRGSAYLAGGQPLSAEAEFRKALAKPFLEPLSLTQPLAWLGLARALAAEGRRPQAAEAYEHFLALWSRADSKAVFLTEAKQELAALRATPASR